MLDPYIYTAQKDGPHLLVFGVIHGEEPCGKLGIEKIAGLFDEKKLELKAGRLTMIPVCNPAAFAENKIFIDENLNRIFTRYAIAENNEQRLANELTAYVDRCDALLDLHSMTAAGVLVFQDYEDKATENFAHAMTSVQICITGWNNMYGAKGNVGLISKDTTGYAHAMGKPGITVECGQHRDSNAPAIAAQSIIDSLVHFKMIEAPEPARQSSQRTVDMHTLVKRPDGGGRLARSWKHLQEIEAGTVLYESNNGAPIIAPVDSVILLPRDDLSQPELMYLGSWVAPSH